MSLATPDAFQRSGKTPPPAPSAAFAKRAREMQEDSMAGRYRPPALRGLSTSHVASDAIQSAVAGPVVDDLASPLPPPSHPPGFRRARAGTLPSNVQLAAQHFASSPVADSPDNLGPHVDAHIPSARPSLRHTASVASAISSTSRLRSGSLTLPSNGLSNAFGSSIFSSNWLASSGLNALDELRSITSTDSVVDDYDVHTLDYLGLDDAPLRSPPPATVSELRNQAQAAIAGSLRDQPARLRATTVSNPYRRRNIPSLLATPAVEIEEAEEKESLSGIDYAQPAAVYEGSLLTPASVYPNNASFVAKGFKQSSHLGDTASRPRAISVGNIDDSNRVLGARRATIVDTPAPPPGLTRKPSYGDLAKQPPNSAGLIAPGLPAPAINAIPPSILRKASSEMLRSPAPNTPSFRLPSAQLRQPGDMSGPRISTTHLSAPIKEPRPVSPSRENTQGQVPSRSLWIGNLDPSMTGEALAHVFAPYGAIESFRLLPEKECGFVNFIDMADAIHAKDDVLGRLGGMIGMANGQPVRIGFGKADSAPLTPIAGGGNQAPMSANPSSAHPVFNPNTPGAIFSPSSPNPIESQLQSAPTRALWIGSIPATTTPATILSIFSPFGPIESARVLTHKNCGFVNFERLDDAVRARKALNGRDVLGSDVGAVRIGFARVPVKNTGNETPAMEDKMPLTIHGVGELTVGATIHALRSIKGASTIPADQQVLGGSVENYRSNLLLSLISSGHHEAALASPHGDENSKGFSRVLSVSEQQMIMKELSAGSQDADADVAALADFRPPVTYYTSIPLVSDRTSAHSWDASKLREIRKRIDGSACTTEEIDQVAAEFLTPEIVDLASDWLGNTVVQKLFEKCSSGPRLAMLELLAPHLAMIGIHKNGTWAAQKIIDCANTPEEVALVAENLRPFAPPLLLDQFGNYVVQCCLKFGAPANDFIIDAMIDRLWEVAQGRFGARSMRAVLESQHITASQQRRIATAIILNSIPLATNANGTLLLTWLLDGSGFYSRYRLLAPRFTPHLSHLCTHKLASSTVLRIINQKVEPEASTQIVEALFNSPGDQVLGDVLSDQVNGVSLVHKILTSTFIDVIQRQDFAEATKRILLELKVTGTQAYRRLVEEVGLPVPSFAQSPIAMGKKPFNPSGYGMSDPASLAAMLAAMQMQGQPIVGMPQLQINPGYGRPPNGNNGPQPSPGGVTPGPFTPGADGFNRPALRSEITIPRNVQRRGGGPSGANTPTNPPPQNGMSPLSLYAGVGSGAAVNGGAPNASQAGNAFGQPFTPATLHPQLYQQYMFELYRQQNAAAFHA